jgi:hypothetical protein
VSSAGDTSGSGFSTGSLSAAGGAGLSCKETSRPTTNYDAIRLQT